MFACFCVFVFVCLFVYLDVIVQIVDLVVLVAQGLSQGTQRLAHDVERVLVLLGDDELEQKRPHNASHVLDGRRGQIDRVLTHGPPCDCESQKISDQKLARL
jgi:hypothetical protein